MEDVMEKVSWGIEMEDSMRDIGNKTWETEKVLKGIPLTILTSDSSNMEKLMAKESTLGKTEKSMMENGIKV